MNTQKTTVLLLFSGAFLLLCGITLFALHNFTIGLTNFSLLANGVICSMIGYFMYKKNRYAFGTGLVFASVLVLYFGWLSIININGLMNMILDGELQLKPYNAVHQQSSALIFSLAAWFLVTVASVTQFVRAYSVGEELSEISNQQQSL